MSVMVKIGKLSKFEGDGYDVLKFDILGEAIHEVHKKIKDNFTLPGNVYEEFSPHLTLAYVLPGSCDHLLGLEPFAGQEFNLEDFDYSSPPRPGEKDRHIEFKVNLTATVQPLGVRAWAKKLLPGILFTAEPLLNRIVKLAKELLENDPKFKGYQSNPALAKTLGAAQKALGDARTEDEVQAAWAQHNPDGIPYDQLRSQAEGLVEEKAEV